MYSPRGNAWEGRGEGAEKNIIPVYSARRNGAGWRKQAMPDVLGGVRDSPEVPGGRLKWVHPRGVPEPRELNPFWASQEARKWYSLEGKWN